MLNENQIRKRALVITITIIVVTIILVGSITVSGVILVATSPYTIQQVTETINSTNHIRLVDYLGQAPDGKTIFTYRRVNYGVFTAFKANSEDSQIREVLSINRVTRD